ncbi:MAG: cellulose biosynthesis protein BcsS [Hyphomicrobiales bacterium]|nr:cellulose biosynthesis protein BcsS [Hyphomicrobiales bacterium]
MHQSKIFATLGLALLGLICSNPGRADSNKKSAFQEKIEALLKDKVDTFSGGGVSGETTSGYAGAIIALNGKNSEKGPLLRLFTGNGQYTYSADKQYELKSVTNGDEFAVDFGAQTFSAEMMLGYQQGWRTAWVKIFAGIAYEHHDISITALALKNKTLAPVDPDFYRIGAGDPGNASSGDNTGAKIRAEIWAPLSKSVWVSADAALASANYGYSGFTRLGVKMNHDWPKLPQVTFGPEVSIFGADDYGAVRSGGFATFMKRNYEFTVSGGISTDYEGETEGYGNIGVYRKF